MVLESIKALVFHLGAYVQMLYAVILLE